MEARNLFRFVSVRPPVPAQFELDCRLENAEAGAAFVAEVAAHRADHRESLPEARRAVAEAVIGSDQYFARSEVWKSLRPLRTQILDLLAELCAEQDDEHGDDAELRNDDATRLFSTIAADDGGAGARQILWRSYYANVLAPEIRPNDRPEMLDWLRIVTALQKVQPPPEREDERWVPEGCACVNRLWTSRVVLPQELFVDRPIDTPVPEQPPEPALQDGDRIRGVIEELVVFRGGLDRLYQARLSSLRLAGARRASPGAQPVGDAEGREAAADGTSAAGSQPARRTPPPWVITEDDADRLPKLPTSFDRLGIQLAGASLPELTNRLDELIAEQMATLMELESQVDVLGVGPTMTLVRRTGRGFRASPTEAAGRSDGPSVGEPPVFGDEGEAR